MQETEYDRVPYHSHPYGQTHPDNIGMLGRMFGLDAAHPERCRVLELGCGAGGNLLPMAASLPESEFVGIDLAATAIATARSTAEALGLRNVRFEAGSITEVDESWGRYDYIICHGVYSWVPEPVRVGILRAIRACLAPQGVAFVSYNAMPAWGMRGIARDIMMFHVKDIDDPAERATQGRAVLDFLVGATSPTTDWGTLLREEVKKLRQVSDWYLHHDNLSPENQPFWFHEFASHLDAAGLHYLGDAAFTTMVLQNLPPTAVKTLQQLGGELIRTEQYMDFVRCRAFRQSLIVQPGHALRRHLDPTILPPFRFVSRARPVSEPVDVASESEAMFRTSEGIELTMKSPIPKAMLVELYERAPVAVGFEELVQAVRRRVGHTDDDPVAVGRVREAVATNLFNCFCNDVAYPRYAQRPIAGTVGERPEAWFYARHQAKANTNAVTNLRHEQVTVSAFDRAVLIRLDGTLTHAEIAAALLDDVQEGRLRVRGPEGEFPDVETTRREIERELVVTLGHCRRSALLVP